MNTVNFWDQTHPLTAKSDALFEQLVPMMGMAGTLQGELIRASSKISYDWYNNGWGCNNWSGASVFIRKHIGRLPVNAQTEAATAKFEKALAAVHQYSHGEDVDGLSDDRASQLVTLVHEYVVQAVLDNPEAVTNSVDMLDLSEPDVRYTEEDEYEDYTDY